MATLLGRKSRHSDHGSNGGSPRPSSSRHRSSATSSRKGSIAQLDDWSDGFTGLVDLDKRMRELAMAECGASSTMHGDESRLGLFSEDDVVGEHRRKSTSECRNTLRSLQTSSSSSVVTGLSGPSISATASTFNQVSSGSTSATSRLSSQDSRSQVDSPSSLLSKRRASINKSASSTDQLTSGTRLAPLPPSASPFGHYRLTDVNSWSTSEHQPAVYRPAEWDEADPLTPMQSLRLEPVLTPGTAAAATWTDPTAPAYFPAGLADEKKRCPRSLRKKQGRVPLPRLTSGEVMSSPISSPVEEPSPGSVDLSLDSFARPSMPASPTKVASNASEADGMPTSYALRRSAQSFALGLRFKMLRAKRKIKRTGQGAVDLFASPHNSDRSSNEMSAIST